VITATTDARSAARPAGTTHGSEAPGSSSGTPTHSKIIATSQEEPASNPAPMRKPGNSLRSVNVTPQRMCENLIQRFKAAPRELSAERPRKWTPSVRVACPHEFAGRTAGPGLIRRDFIASQCRA